MKISVTKKDVSGKDTEQLPVQSSKETGSEKASLFQVGILAAVLLGIVATIIFVVIYWQNQNSKVVQVQPSPSPKLKETVRDLEEIQESSSVVEEVIEDEVVLDKEALAELSVQVLNGAGVAGLAGSISNQLEEAGFQVNDTRNADTFDYEGIVVSFKQEFTQSDYLIGLISKIFPKYDVTEGTDLHEGSAYDIVITIGT